MMDEVTSDPDFANDPFFKEVSVNFVLFCFVLLYMFSLFYFFRKR